MSSCVFRAECAHEPAAQVVESFFGKKFGKLIRQKSNKRQRSPPWGSAFPGEPFKPEVHRSQTEDNPSGRRRVPRRIPRFDLGSTLVRFPRDWVRHSVRLELCAACDHYRAPAPMRRRTITILPLILAIGFAIFQYFGAEKV